jgi:peptidoglycan/LPS O-acetylase OafA/YrhL
MTPMTPEDARHQLVAADALATTSATDSRIGAFTTAGVGVLVGAVLAMSNAFAETNPVAFTIGMAGYGVALGALILWHLRRVRVSKRGWSRRYRVSLAFTMVLYGIGIGWSTSGSPSWVFFAPYCVLVALPMVLVASRMTR